MTSADTRFELVVGDIVRQQVDAIVNAANSSLLGGGGVDGAIHRAGGPRINEECLQIRAQRGSLPPGAAVATSAGDLHAKHVIHTVGPVWHGGRQGETHILASCYRVSLRLAEELGAESIAFPSISTGAFGFPVESAAPIAVSTVRAHLESSDRLKLVRFVLFDDATYRAFAALL